MVVENLGEDESLVKLVITVEKRGKKK